MTRMENGRYVVTEEIQDTKDTKKHNGHDVMCLGGSKKFHAKAQSAQRKGAKNFVKLCVLRASRLCGRCDLLKI